jgi:hypothetical protein
MAKYIFLNVLFLAALLLIDAFGLDVIIDPYEDIDYDEINTYYPNDPCAKDE